MGKALRPIVKPLTKERREKTDREREKERERLSKEREIRSTLLMLDLKTERLYDSGKKTKVRRSIVYKFLELMKICGIRFVELVVKLEKDVSG